MLVIPNYQAPFREKINDSTFNRRYTFQVAEYFIHNFSNLLYRVVYEIQEKKILPFVSAQLKYIFYKCSYLFEYLLYLY